MRNLQAQTIFFSATSTQTFFLSGNGFANNFFYEMQCFIMRSLMLLNNIGSPVFMLPYFSAVVPEFFCCLRIPLLTRVLLVSLLL